MGRVVQTAVINAPQEQVFDYRLNLENLPHYNPDVTDLRKVAEGAPGVGARYRFRVKVAPAMNLDCDLTVTRVERPTTIEFRVKSLFDATEVCTFEAIGDDARPQTRLRFETIIDTPGGFLAPLIDAIFVRPAARRQIAEELRRMELHHDQSAADCGQEIR